MGARPCRDLARGRSCRRQRGAAGLTPAGQLAGITRAGTLPAPRASPGHGCPDTLLLARSSVPGWQPGTPWPCTLPAVPSGVTDLSPLLSPDVLAGWGSSDAEGREGLGSVWLCQRRCAVPAAAQQRLWARRDGSGAERGGAGDGSQLSRRCQESGAGSAHPELVTVSWLVCRTRGRDEGSSLPFPGERKERRGTRLAAAPRHGGSEAQDGSVRERGAAGTARLGAEWYGGMGPVGSGGCLASLPREGGMAAAVGAPGQGGNGCSSCAWASLVHSLGCPWKCQGVPSSTGRALGVPVLLERGWCQPRAVLAKGPGPSSCFPVPAHVCEEQRPAQRHL